MASPKRTSLWSRSAAALGLTLALSGCAGAAGTGRPLLAPGEEERASQGERHDALARWEIVTEPLEFERDGHWYVGGVATGLVKATPDQILAALGDVEALAEVLPRTKRATLIDARGTTRRLELVQGNSIVEAKYTVVLSASESPGRMEFQLDRSRPHDIDDVYGYFTVTPFDDERSAITVAAAVDVGSGLTHALFGRRVQDVILSTPYAMREYFGGGRAEQPAALVAHNSPR